MDPFSLFQYVGTAASIASFLRSEDLAATAKNVRRYFADVPDEMRYTLVSNEGLAFINLLIIDRDLLDDLVKDVRQSENDYRRCLQRGKTRQERDACDAMAERKICETLNRIMNRNGGQLPTDYLRKHWQSYGCAPTTP